MLVRAGSHTSQEKIPVGLPENEFQWHDAPQESSLSTISM